MAIDLEMLRNRLSIAEGHNNRDEQKKAIYALIDIVDLLALEISKNMKGESK